MKKFLKILFFLLLWVVLLAGGYDALNLWLIRQSPSNNAGKIERLFLSAPDGEIAIFGSSRALGNYLPSMIAPNCYDYGVNGMGMTETLFLAGAYLQRHRPQLVIIDLSPWGFDDPAKAKYVGDYRLAARASEVRAMLPKGRLGWTDWMPGIRFQGKLRNSLVQYLNARKATTKRIDQGAEVLLNSRSDAEWKVMDQTISTFGFDFPTAAQKALADFYALAGKTKILWVVTPISPFMRDHFTGSQELTNFLAEQQKRPSVSSVSYLDQTSDFPRDLFTDHRHLNVNGAKRLMKRFHPVK